MPTITFLITTFLFLVFATAASGQTERAAVDPPTDTSRTFTFKSGVSNVRMDAQVTENGNLVTNLTKNDFLVYEGTRQQNIIYFGHDAEPVNLLLLLDVSGSMRKYVEQVADVARESLRHLHRGDRVGIMLFSKGTKVLLPFTDNLTTAADTVRQATQDQGMSPYTAINDALIDAAKYMDEQAGEKGRRAILILTDNLGLNYKSPDQPVIDEMFGSDSVVNAIVVGKGERPEPVTPGRYTNPDFTPPNVFMIADQTGGEAVKASQASTAFAEMIERIRTRYSLHYALPAHSAAGFHPVRIELTPEAQRRFPYAVIHARKGYFVKQQ